jgi:molybdate transport system substrate-binding protein
VNPRYVSLLGACIAAVLVAAAATGCATTPAGSAGAASPVENTVSAAQSLKKPLTELAKRYEAANPGTKVVLNFGASGQLAQQIEQGAPVDAFFSASGKDPKALAAKGILATDTVAPFIGNTLVVAVPKGNPANVRTLADLAKPELKRWTTGNPAAVPHGKYTQESLEKLGIWDAAKEKVVFSENVAQTLSYVDSGQVDAGVLFNSEALKAKEGTIVATVPDDLHKPIAYYVGLVSASKNTEAAKRFVAFATGPEAVVLYVAEGFRQLAK